MNRTVYGIVQPLDYVEPKRHRHNTASALGMDIIRVGGWARNADRLIRVILGAEEEEVEHDPEAGEWIQSAGRLARIGFGLMFVGITAWSTAALASAGSGFTLGRSEYIGLLASEELPRAFAHACRMEHQPAAQVVRELMRGYISGVRADSDRSLTRTPAERTLPGREWSGE